MLRVVLSTISSILPSPCVPHLEMEKVECAIGSLGRIPRPRRLPESAEVDDAMQAFYQRGGVRVFLLR